MGGRGQCGAMDVSSGAIASSFTCTRMGDHTDTLVMCRPLKN